MRNRATKVDKIFLKTEKVHESDLMDLISDTKQVSAMKDLSHEHLSHGKKKDIIRCIYKRRGQNCYENLLAAVCSATGWRSTLSSCGTTQGQLLAPSDLADKKLHLYL